MKNFKEYKKELGLSNKEFKIIFFSTLLLYLSIILALIYGISISIHKWKIYLLVFAILVLMAYLNHLLEKVKENKIIKFTAVIIMSVLCLTGSFYILSRVIKDSKNRLSYTRISDKEIIESLQKSKEEIKNALISIDESLNTLTDTRSKIDMVIAQTYNRKEDFLSQIDKLNKAEDVAKGLDYKTREIDAELKNIQKIIGGKKILTVEEFEKNKIKDLIIAFFMGIVTSLITSLIANLIIKGKYKTHS